MKLTIRLFILMLAWAALGCNEAQAQTCSQVSTLNYTTSANGDRRVVATTVGGTTVTTSGYTTTVTGGNTNTFAVGTNTNLPSKALVWQQNTKGATGATAGQPTDPATVTYTFSRPVTNLTLVLTDVDRNVATAKFVDQVTFDGYVNANDATPIALAAADVMSGTANSLVAGTNSVVGTATSNATAAGNVTVTFPQPVTKLVLSYQNTYAYNAADDRTQTTGINSIAFCSQADVYARFTAGPATAITGQNVAYTVQFGNNGPDIAATTVTRQVTIPNGAIVTNAGGGTVTGNTIDFGNVATLNSGTSSSFSYAYNLPAMAGTYNNTATITAGSSATGYDPAANNTASRSVLVTSVAGACATAPVDLNFRTRQTGENWRNKTNEGVPVAASVTKIQTTTYNSPDNASTLAIGTIAGRTLRWDVNYGGNNGGSPNSSTVTYKFSRPLSNFSVRVQDIDGNVTSVLGAVNRTGFTDQVEFSGKSSNANVGVVVTKVEATSTTVSVAGNIATGNLTAATSADNGAVIATFTNPIDELTLVYRNVITGTGSLGGSTGYTAQAVGIDAISWCRQAPLANNVTNATLPSAAGQVSIGGLSSSVDGMVQTYTLVSVPTPAQGVLYYNSNGSTYLAAAAGQTLTDAQAASLRFDPAPGASGNVTFTYSVQDDANLTSNTATYTIPVNNTACAVNTTTLSFAAQPAAEDWKAHAALAVPTGSPLTTIRSSGYTSPASATLSTLMTADQNGVQSLQWFTDYANTTANSSSVTFTFLRPVSNFAVRVQDIDAVQDNNNAFIDRVTFAGANAGVAVTPVLSPVNPDNGSVIITGTSATGTVNNTSPDDASVMAYFPNPITTLTLTYANISTFATNPTQNAIGIDLMSWCQLAPTATTITNATLPATAPQTAISPLAGTADGVLQTYTLTSLPTPASGILYVGSMLATVNQPLTAAQITQLSFDPDPSFMGTATFTYTITDGQNNVSVPATYSIPVSAVADVAMMLTGPATLNAGQPTGTYLASFTNNGPSTADGVMQQVTLPTGATLTTAQLATIQGAYPGTTFTGGVLYFSGTPVSLANGATNTYSFVFTAPTTTGSSTLAGNVGTTTAQGANASADAATLALTTNGVSNVTATISGNGPVAAGSTGTFSVIFGNSGPQAATNVSPSVQLPAGLAGVVVTPAAGLAGSYNPATGLVTFTAVGGGPVPSLGVGTGTSTISYTQPFGPVTATAAISTASTEAGLTNNNTASATISANPVFDVATTISGPATATAGGQVAYNVTTSNGSPSPATNVVQMVTLPAGATNIFVTGNGAISGNTVTFPALATLMPGQVVTQTVSFTAPAADYSVGASATPAAGDANPANNTRTASTTVAAPPVTTTFANAFVSIVAGTTAAPSTAVSTVDAGTSLTFTVTEGNNGRDAATGVVTRVAIPTGLPISGVNALKIGLNGATPAAPTITAGTVATYGSGTTAITYDSATGIVTSGTTSTQPTGAGNYQTFALVFNAPVSGVVTATADVSTTTIDNVAANNLATAQVTVNPALVDVVTTLAGPTAATAGERLTYTLTTSNNGPAPAANVAQMLTIPAGLSLAGPNALTIDGNLPTSIVTDGMTGVTTATYGTGTTAITYNQSTGAVTMALITSQAAGTAQSTVIAYNAPANGNLALTNVASATTTSPEANPANNSVSVITALQAGADVRVAISGPATAVAGSSITYSVITTNGGPNVAATVVTTVQLPTGLTNVVVRDVSGSPLTNSATTGYSTADGIVRFTAQTNQYASSTDASIGTITFDVPTTTNLLQPTATATVSGTVPDPIAANNSATVATVVKPATTTLVDMATSVSVTAPSLNPTSVSAGTTVTFTVVTRSNTTGATATNVVQTLQLPAGLPLTGTSAVLVNNVAPSSVNATTGIATYPDNSTYDPATGLVTFPLYATFAGGSSVNNTVTIVAPGATPLVASAVVRADQSDPTSSSNTSTRAQPVALTPDVATTISGPLTTVAGAPVSYTVVTSNAGLSPVAGTTQSVKLPVGVTSYSLNGGVAITVASGATISIPVPATIYPGATGTVSNVISFVAPNAASFTVSGTVSATNDAVTTGNNTASQTTTLINKAPVAANIVNSLQGPQGNTAGQLLIAPLSALDPEGSALTYIVTTAPDATQGRLYYNNNGTYTLVADGQPLTATQAQTLRFDPTANYVGNASFQYTATDAQGAVSNTGLYLVPVGADNPTAYTPTPTKGGNTNQYQNGDVLAYGIDPNGAVYNTAGLVYNLDGSNPGGVVSNGLRMGKLSVADSTALANLGVRYTSGTGLFTVVDRTKLPRTGQTVAVGITTVDMFGGITTQTFSLILGQNPLPVELTAFTATAVKNVDAALVWHTASEKNNDHFEVERSLNGADFVQIGQVSGQGTRTSATAYALTDAGIGAKAAGLVYYRLKQVDTEGTSSYSPVRTVAFTKALAVSPSISLWPNPATSATQLDLSQLPAGRYEVQVLDATGRAVLATTMEAGLAHGLDLGQVASGSYVVLVRGQANGQVINLSKRLVKE